MNKIKKDDEVIVITGRDKGKTGKVLQILDDGRALVNDIQLVKKHVKANPMAGVTGGIVTQEAPIQLSNLAIYNSKTSKADKIRIAVEDGKKQRVFKSDGSKVDS